VAITDFDDAMKAALAAQFPDTQQQICIHHIHSNVLLQARRRWIQSDRAQDQFSDGQGNSEPNSSNAKSIPHSPNGIHQQWKMVAFAETEEQHNQAWTNFCKQFDDQPAILLYFWGTYMPVREQ
jgi:hypothetical protein